jgi:hypothetical protein
MRPTMGVALAVVLVGCAAMPWVPPIGEETRRLDPIGFDAVRLSDDRVEVLVEFVGGAPYDPADPCSTDYEVSAEVDEGELVIGIFPLAHPRAGEDGVACALVGFARSARLVLDVPFDGNVVRDLRGQTLHLGPPDGLAVMPGLPAEWRLVAEGSLLGGDVARWRRTWSLGGRWPASGPGVLQLIQSFDGPVQTTGGQDRSRVEVGGEPATLFLHRPTGQLVLVWAIGRDGFALVANVADFTGDELIALAESVVRD